MTGRPPGERPSWLPADVWDAAARPDLDRLVDALTPPALALYREAAERTNLLTPADHEQAVRAVVALVVNALQPAAPPASYHSAGRAVDVDGGAAPRRWARFVETGPDGLQCACRAEEVTAVADVDEGRRAWSIYAVMSDCPEHGEGQR